VFEYPQFTWCEAEVFHALSGRRMAAEELSVKTVIPYTRVYTVLGKLLQLNLVQRIPSNSAMFSIHEKEVVISILCEESKYSINGTEGHIANYLYEIQGK
jgi:sugar-specific transcriptional regulator TrmB